MVALTGDSKDNVLRGTNSTDSIVGNGGADTLSGLGGDDSIDGGAGNDTINGDGVYTVADAVKEAGWAEIAYTGTVTSPTGLLLTSMGRMVEFDGDTVSVWRIRNATDGDLTVVLRASSGHSTQTVTVSAHSDYFITSADVSTHALLLNGSQVSVKAPSTTTFSHTGAYGPSVDGNDTLVGGFGADTISGGGGDDLIDGGADSDTLDGGNGNDLIYGGGAADLITGGSGNDVAYGEAGNDTMEGGTGNDILNGGEGADAIDGGDGYDHADYRKAASGVTVNLVTGLGSRGDAEGDTYTSIENVFASAFDDVITVGDENNELSGRDGNDILNGGGGNDILNGGAGFDELNGGAGYDTASYEGSGSGVGVNLATGGFGGRAGGDTYSSIENVAGSSHADVIIGDGLVNKLDGAAGNDDLQGAGGNDTLIGGAGGDMLNGGDGIDTASYDTAAAGVALSLVTGGTAGDADGDRFASIEFVVGSAHDDFIFGDDLNNRIYGNDGNDELQGGGGKDALIGDAGNDTLMGGAGYDVFWFRAADQGNDTVLDFAAGAGIHDRVWLGGASGVNDWAGVLAAAQDVAEGVLLSLANGTVLLSGLTVSALAADDFLF